MSYILDTLNRIKDAQERKDRWARYYEYLNAIKEKLPVSVYDFASSTWHYDPTDPRCPHDAWLDSLQIQELHSESDPETRELELRIHLANAYAKGPKRGNIELTYENVHSYSLTKPPSSQFLSKNNGHYDWLIDEIRLSDRGLVEHEIEFSSGSKWIIECTDVHYLWIPLQDTPTSERSSGSPID